MSRLILTIRKLLKNYEKIGTVEKLRQFGFVVNEGELSFLLDEDMTDGQKK